MEISKRKPIEKCLDCEFVIGIGNTDKDLESLFKHMFQVCRTTSQDVALFSASTALFDRF
jgi:hypothetical protein